MIATTDDLECAVDILCRNGLGWRAVDFFAMTDLSVDDSSSDWDPCELGSVEDCFDNGQNSSDSFELSDGDDDSDISTIVHDEESLSGDSYADIEETADAVGYFDLHDTCGWTAGESEAPFVLTNQQLRQLMLRANVSPLITEDAFQLCHVILENTLIASLMGEPNW
jgi:hypothetical protein